MDLKFIVKVPNADKYERHFKYLKQIQIPLPSLPEQTRIVNEITNKEARIAEIEEQLAQIPMQKQEILKKALLAE